MSTDKRKTDKLKQWGFEEDLNAGNDLILTHTTDGKSFQQSIPDSIYILCSLFHRFLSFISSLYVAEAAVSR